LGQISIDQIMGCKPSIGIDVKNVDPKNKNVKNALFRNKIR